MPGTSVLAIGLDPTCADPATFGGLSPDAVKSYVVAQLALLQAQGYDVESCLICPGESAEDTLKRALEARTFDCVVIGAGLRQPASQLLLFERIINLVHERAPQARICFNTKPADTIDAVQRWVPSS